MVHLGKGFHLYKDLYESLYVHQQEGVLWMWSLYRQRKGGILGDDMGLGKTIQVIAFLSGMFDMQKITSVLIVLPVALMVNWENELKKWAPGLKVVAFHGNSKREKERALARVQRRGGICLTTYGLVVTSWEQLGTQDGREFVWDYMILDEGHKIKNPTKTSKGVHAIPAKNRIILTGTPVQNNLKELWALFDFVHQGSLLGTQRTFKMEYETPITRAREKDATSNEKKLGMEMAESLKRIISPFFLRRTKAEVKERESKDKQKPDNKSAKHAVMPTMTRKNDLIVWTFLSQAQQKIYEDFLHLESVKELLMTTKSPLVALNVLKKICDHPRLLSTRACSQLGIEGDEGLDEDMLETEAGNLSAVTRIQHVADHILINESGKLVFLVNLLDQLKVEGHRCLVFSQSRKMLDIMEKVLTNRGHKIMRLDGTISQVQEREQRIKKFQSDDSYSVFLLTTQVGGVGLTLTAANRVVIYDPSWNPATDAQAVDRVFRIGQNKNVVIYRLITCGTVEEKIYRRQIFKDSITRQTTGNAKNPYRYFSKYELRELFTLDDPKTSTTQQQLDQMYSGQRLTDPSLDEHIAFLYSLEMFGLSDHDLMFTQGKGRASETSDDEHEVDQQQENDYIQHRVQKAQELLQMESQQEMGLEERQGKHQGPSGPAGPRNHMWEMPKPKQEEDLTEESMEEDNEANTTTSSADRDNRDESMIDLTSPAPNRVNIVKEEPTEIDLTTPVVKKEEVQEEEKMEIWTTPKKPGTPRTIREGLIISPDPTKPLIQMSPMKHVNRILSVEKPAKPPSKLNATLFTYEDSPAMELKENEKSSNGRIIVGDSPVSATNLHQNSKRIHIPDTPDMPNSDRNEGMKNRNNSADVDDSSSEAEGDKTCDMINESVIDESMVSNGDDALEMDQSQDADISPQFEGSDTSEPSNRGNISVKEVKDILERSLVQGDKMDDSHDIDRSVLSNKCDVSVQEVKGILERSLMNDGSDQEDLDDVPRRRPAHARRSISARKPVIESSEEEEEALDETGDDDCDNDNDHNDNSADDDIADNSIDENDNDEDDNGAHDINDKDSNSANGNNGYNSDADGVESHDDDNDDENYDDEDNKENENINANMQKSNKRISLDKDLSPRKKHFGDNVDSSRTYNKTPDKHSVNDSENGEIGADEQNGGEHHDDDDDEHDEEEDYSEEEEEEEEVDEFEELPEEEQIRYNQLVEMGRSLCQQKKYEEGQAYVLQALEIYPDEGLQKTAISIQNKILKKQMREAMSS